MTRSTAQAESPTQAFAELVVTYRDLLEQLAADPSLDVFTRLHAHLVDMVSGVLLLSRKSNLRRKASKKRIQRVVEDNRYIYDRIHPVLDPMETRLAKIHGILEEAIEWRGSLSYHLSDIYDDVMQGLRIYERSGRSARKDAAGHWHVGFDIHWGQNHVYNALFILHYFVYNFEDLEDDECEDE